jgi:hypothetical protein
MAARSFSITVVNYTGRNWTRGGMSLNHGIWSPTGPSDDEARVPPSTYLVSDSTMMETRNLASSSSRANPLDC